jgi:hypothetical protein
MRKTFLNVPKVEILFENGAKLSALFDSGSEVNLVEEMVHEGINVPVLPFKNVVLVTSFGERNEKVRKQTFVNFAMAEDTFGRSQWTNGVRHELSSLNRTLGSWV